jgi:pyruvate dehydrogenase E1 component alpha subunit
MHIADIDTGNLGANGIVGGGIPIGVGAGLGIKIRETHQVVVIFFSDGASNNGVFAESVNLAAIWDLPVVFVLENNDYAVSTCVDECSRTCDLYRRAEGYCVNAMTIDGNDVLVVYEQAREAVEDCRAGRGPVLIECKTYRHGGHHVNDPGTYMPEEKLEYFKSRDPVKIGRQYLMEQGSYSEKQIFDIEAEVDGEMEEAIEFAKNSPEPSVETFLEEIAWY